MVRVARVHAAVRISDDGLIDVRVAVREILAGNGPVYNAFERVEPNTSALWTWLLAFVCAIAGGDLARDAVITGGVLSVGALIVALDGARAWHRARGATTPLLPFGALVVCTVLPFRDFATSGLEGSLGLAWIAASYRLLVATRAESSRRFQLGLAVVIGLGPLVRARTSRSGLASCSARRGRRAAPPVAAPPPRPRRRGHRSCRSRTKSSAPAITERLVPLPAITKSATGAAVGARLGLRQLNYASPYALWGRRSALAVSAWRRERAPS